MNPIQLSKHLHEAFIDYLSTIFDVNRDGQEAILEAALQASFHAPGALMRGPFLEITPPYKRGVSILKLCDEGVLSEEWRSLGSANLPIPLDAKLYLHQEQAIRAYNDGRSIVVSSGTGSGKTEAFLIPILDDLMKDPRPGVRAVLIYPMNALVNDQLDRLRTLLRGTDITFGRYTSELAQNEREGRRENTLPNEVVSRETIRDGRLIPQILITNYAMLEYLLLRPEDSPLFESGLWRFLVLDEAHTYAGAQGTEVAFLIRRLKQRLGKKPGDMICIATSATLTDKPEIAAAFAGDIFAETFAESDILIGEEDEAYVPDAETYEVNQEAYLDEQINDILDDLRNPTTDITDIAQRMTDVGLVPEKYRASSNEYMGAADYLWDAMRGNPHLSALRRGENHWRTNELNNIAEEIFGDLPDDDQIRALHNLIELGSLARPDEKSAPMLSARYHVFMRPPQGIWVCLNPNCSGKHEGTEGWSRVFATKRERCDSCNALIYPLVVCRDCGQTYVQTWFSENKYHAEDVGPDDEKRYLLWREPQVNHALSDDEDDELEEMTSNKRNSSQKTEKHMICLSCGQEDPRHCCDTPILAEIYLAMTIEQGRGRSRLVPLKTLNECLRCSAVARDDTEIATPIAVTGPTPLSVLTTELYRRLPGTSEKPGNGRKLLTFYDSRQGAARFASFLQDVANEQQYNHVIPRVVRQVESGKEYRPNLDTVTESAIQLGWEERLYHLDEDLKSKLKLDRKKPSQNDRETLDRQWKTIILAEFTTRRRRRQSLESLGVLGVKYFEDDDDFDVTELAYQLQMSNEQTRTLIEFLLDDIRHSKIIDFPDNVAIDDERFGRNQSNPRLVISNPQSGEVTWIGSTERHRRNQYMQKVLRTLEKPSSFEHVQVALTSIWDWLTKSSDLFVGTSEKGYQLDCNSIYLSGKLTWCQCQQCRRIYARADSLPCPHPRCSGSLKAVATESIQGRNYFYQNMHRDIIPMRVEEHTAQLDSEKGRDYQDKFRDGAINILSCSTTFEMGIDLGDLQSVVMSNIPPTVANYRQRSGRAGRRAGGAAFILSWADERPHDQAYFNDPIQIIEGRIKVPYIALDNAVIRQRHMNAVLLSAFMRYRKSLGYSELSKVAPFFEPNRLERHYDDLEPWLNKHQSSAYQMLQAFVEDNRESKVISQSWLSEFRGAMWDVHDKYHKRFEYYTQQIESTGSRAISGMTSKDLQDIQEKQLEFTRLRERMNNEGIIEFLSNSGVLPSYSFPLHTVELILPAASRGLRLQRDLRQAIREYAPKSEIVADKRIWRSDGVRFYRGDTVLWREYVLCEHCNYIQISEVEGKQLDRDGDTRTCPACNHRSRSRRNSSIKRFITPDDFFAGRKDNGKPARQYVKHFQNDMRSALIPGQNRLEERQHINPYLDCTYERKGQLLYVNEGEHGSGFKLSLTGINIGQVDKNASPVSLGHIQDTDVLHLYFKGDLHIPLPGLEDGSFWLSLMYALIQGACRALQIERRDIDGVLSPQATADGKWEQVIVLYDNVPGGAGHVKHIQDEFKLVLEEALKILNCSDCSPDTSCYRCIRDYNNQFYHSELKREHALKYLELIYYADSVIQESIRGAGYVMALNPDYWLFQQVQNAKQSVSIWVDGLSIKSIPGTQYDWLDGLQDCLRRGLRVNLNLSGNLRADWVLIHHLRHLCNQGLQIHRVPALPEWHILLDERNELTARGIQIKAAQDKYILGDDIEGLVSTRHPEGIRAVVELTSTIWSEDFVLPRDPEKNKVITIKNGQIATEQDLFAEYFSEPVMRIRVNDPYLTDRYRIVERLGSYLSMAADGGLDPSMEVITTPDNRNKPSDNQKRAFQTLQSRYGGKLNVRYSGAEHDRFVELTHHSGKKTKIIIGRGLDFIQQDGKCLKTYITITRD